MCNEIECSYDKIIITIVPSYTGKYIVHLLLLALLLVLRTRNNTDGYKLVIFSGIDLYYGDTIIPHILGIAIESLRYVEVGVKVFNRMCISHA